MLQSSKTGESIMALQPQDIEAIGNYVRQQLPLWIRDIKFETSYHEKDIELRERAVRVEEELKNQRELMKQGFEFMEKRFEQVDKRFEQMERRFEQIDQKFSRLTILMGLGFTMVSTLVTVFQFLK